MLSFTHVLCPTDCSPVSRRALRYAVALAGWYDAKLTVLHVTPPPAPPVPFGLAGEVPVMTMPPGDPGPALARELEATGASARAPDIVVAPGRPHAVILEQVEARGADLLVLGTQGHGGVERLLLGSTAEKVVRLAGCPVMTVPPRAAGDDPAVTFGRILCATDFSASARRALAVALDLGRQAGGAVTVLHAIEYLDPYDPEEHVEPDVRATRERLVEYFRQRLHSELSLESRTWCEIHERLAVNRAWREILDTAGALPADLIVMGAQGRGGLELMLYGSTTSQVVRRAACPVLTVRA